jgi:UTP--glucose-1-phosphate uridylyltransferase
LKNFLKHRSVYGYCFEEGVRYDCGSKLGFLKATAELALKHPEVKNEFKKYLKNKVNDL